MKIKAHKVNFTNQEYSEEGMYCISKEDFKKLELIMKQYNITTRTSYPIGRRIFWKSELDEITKQYRLARKQERQK